MSSTIHDVLAYKGGEVFGVAPETTIAEAVALMETTHAGSLMVLAGRDFLGMLCERDIMISLATRHLNADVDPVSAIMQSHTPTVVPSCSIGDAMHVMTEKRCRHLPVMAGRTVVGVVSIGDLLKWQMLDMEGRLCNIMASVDEAFSGMSKV